MTFLISFLPITFDRNNYFQNGFVPFFLELIFLQNDIPMTCISYRK